MKNKLTKVALITFLASGCAANTPLIKANPHTKTFNDVEISLDHCSLNSDQRTARCKLNFVSKYRDRVVAFAGYVRLQDDTGVEYGTKVGFGESASSRKRDQLMVADQVYSAVVEAENLSTRSTRIRAVVLDRIDLSFGPRQHIASHRNIVFSKPVMKAEIANPVVAPPVQAEPANPNPKGTPPGTRSLSGEWREIIFGKEVGIARIEQKGNSLKIWNFEQPPKVSEGFLDSSNVIHATNWGLTGKTSNNGNQIVWSNTVVWIRK